VKNLWKTAGAVFATGLLTLAPVLATLYLITWVFNFAERLFARPLQWLMPGDYHVGMGIVAALVIIFGVGVLMRALVFRYLFRGIEKVMLGIPLVRSIYGAVRDLLGLFAQHEDAALQVVMIVLPGLEVRLLGFVTRTEFDDLPEGIAKEGDVAVYLPMAYNIGGYTVFLPRERIQPVAMSREDAMKFTITAGLKSTPPPARKRR
jgi:uncharacterized membrane protein